MISAIIVKDPSNTPIKWWNDVEWLKGRKKIEFKPGLNILFGPNGSGKSTVLSAIAQMLMCEQGGDQVHIGQQRERDDQADELREQELGAGDRFG